LKSLGEISPGLPDEDTVRDGGTRRSCSRQLLVDFPKILEIGVDDGVRQALIPSSATAAPLVAVYWYFR
jgi:hypothetical protein